MIAWLVVACGLSGLPSAVGEAPPVALRVFLDGAPRAGGGTLVVQAEYDPAGELELPEPVSTGGGGELTFTPDGPPTLEHIGDRRVVTQRFLFRGPKGSYEVPPLVAKWREGDETAEGASAAVFVDLDVPPPREGDLADIIEPTPVYEVPWVWLAAALALVAAGLGWVFRPRRAPAPAVEDPVPPDRAALLAWERVRDDKSLTVDEKAEHIARIFREYIEAVLGFEATSRTTFELITDLETLRHLPEGNVPRARRVLRAADRVKFAEERPSADGQSGIQLWLSDLDADLRAFVESTRPSAWSVPQEPVR